MDNLTESMQLAPGLFLQATAQKFRLHRLMPWDAPPCPESMLSTGDTNITRQLMAGAFYAGFSVPSGNTAAKATARATPHPLLGHVFALAALYQTTRATPPTMRRAAERLAARGQHEAVRHFLNVVEEETGHDTLALLDIEALGLSAQDFVARVRPAHSLALVAWLTQLAESAEPITVLGYAYALERGALFRTEAGIAAIEQLLPPGINATRCVRVHSAAGSDAHHVAESVEFIATLPAPDRAAIARATYATMRLQFSTPQGYPGDAAMQALLDDMGWALKEQVAC